MVQWFSDVSGKLKVKTVDPKPQALNHSADDIAHKGKSLA